MCRALKTSKRFCSAMTTASSSVSETVAQAPWDYAWVGFLGLNARRYLRSLTRTSQSRFVLHDIDVDTCYATIERALPLDPSSSAASLRSNAILFELLACLVEGVGADPQGKTESDVAEAARLIIEMEFGDHLLVSDIAARVGVHPNYLSKTLQLSVRHAPEALPHAGEAREGEAHHYRD